jgi:hypothetical protein
MAWLDFGVVWRLSRLAHPVVRAAVQAATVPRNDRLDIEQHAQEWQ